MFPVLMYIHITYLFLLDKLLLMKACPEIFTESEFLQYTGCLKKIVRRLIKY